MMAEQRVRLTETERLALDFMIAALREGDQDTASLAFGGQEAAFIGGITRITAKIINATRRACPVVIQTAQLATNFVGGGRAALSDPRVSSELNQLRDRSLEELLEALRSGGGQSGYSSQQGTGDLGQLSTQELFEELRRRTS
jgi:phenylpyruvate tautomerase PptA (4-oxalocrotonate tautomerase family)